MSEPPPPPPAPVQPPPPAGSGTVVARQVGTRRSAGLVILLTIVTLGIWTLVWSYQNGDEIKRWSGRGIGGIGYLLITLIFSPITMFLLAGEVEQLYRDEGREPPITVIWGLWFLLPIIGQFIWYFRIQRAINEYWELHGQANSPGL
jgi:hypothetical protein